MSSFVELKLIDPLLRAVAEEGYSQATPIQERAIPHILAGRDLLGLAQTGTGKTAAFGLPLLQRLTERTPAPTANRARPIRALIVTPTRELASQIGESFERYGRHLGYTCTVIFGGVNARPQEDILRKGVDIVVATPGRLLDHMEKGLVRFDGLDVFVLDEADRMLDMGFAPYVKRIIKALPPKRQNLFFSATMPNEVRALAASLLTNPAEVAVVPPATTVEKVAQQVYHVPSADKKGLLVTLLADRALERVLVFTRTKHGANRLVDHLKTYGTDAAVIHGNKSQSAREKALEGFRDGDVRVLVATDIAARGIDIDGISHVVNFDLPNLPESYVHRIGRTARAGATGIAIAMCAPDERAFLSDIEKAIRMRIPVREMPAIDATLRNVPMTAREEGRRDGGGGGGRGRGGQRQAARPPQRPQVSVAPRPQAQPSARPQGGNGGGGGGNGAQANSQRPQGQRQQRGHTPPRPPATPPPRSVVISRLPGESLSGDQVVRRNVVGPR